MIEFPPAGKPLTLNERLHWAARARRVAEWREAAYYAACWSVPRTGKDRVTVHIPVKGHRRRDPHNYMPTCKAIIDGLVDAGVWPDDTPEWVTVAEPVLVVGGTDVRVELEAL